MLSDRQKEVLKKEKSPWLKSAGIFDYAGIEFEDLKRRNVRIYLAIKCPCNFSVVNIPSLNAIIPFTNTTSGLPCTGIPS